MSNSARYPFDARQSWMAEPATDLSKWRTVSLVTALRVVLQHGPAAGGGGAVAGFTGDQRFVFLRNLMTEIDERGIDSDPLVRYGMQREVLGPVISGMVAIHVLGEEAVGLLAERSGVEIEQWRRVFGIGPAARRMAAPALDDDSLDFSATVGAALTRSLMNASRGIGPAVAWVHTADLADVLTLRPPSDGELDMLAAWRPSLPSETGNEYRWLVDRLSTTFLTSWETSSLRLEYRWNAGRARPPCRVDLMLERTPDTAELIAEIARRDALDRSDAQDGGLLAGQIQESARVLLEEGRARDAAALFEFLCKIDPDNADALNNLGFCLIPVAPAEALRHLEAANAFGYVPEVINVCNRTRCYVEMRRFGPAIRLADSHLASVADSEAVPATLWLQGEDGLALRRIPDARAELKRLRATALRRRHPRPRSEPGDSQDGRRGPAVA